MAEHLPTAIRPHQRGGCPKSKVCPSVGWGGKGCLQGRGATLAAERKEAVVFGSLKTLPRGILESAQPAKRGSFKTAAAPAAEKNWKSLVHPQAASQACGHKDSHSQGEGVKARGESGTACSWRSGKGDDGRGSTGEGKWVCTHRL